MTRNRTRKLPTTSQRATTRPHWYGFDTTVDAVEATVDAVEATVDAVDATVDAVDGTSSDGKIVTPLDNSPPAESSVFDA